MTLKTRQKKDEGAAGGRGSAHPFKVPVTGRRPTGATAAPFPLVVSPGGRGRLRVVSFNIAHGRGLMPHQGLTPVSRIRRNLDRIADLLNKLRADVVALQEVDQDSVWNGNFDHADYLREKCGFRWSIFGANTSVGKRWRLTYGNAVLSRLPIVHSEARRFGERAVGDKGFLYCEIEVGGAVVPLVNVHLHHRSRSSRREQAARVIAFVESRRALALGAANGPRRLPPLLMGDFNCAAHVRGDAGELLLEDLLLRDGYTRHPQGLRTYPSLRPTRMLDWVLVPEGVRVAHSGTVRSRLSDHLPVVVDLEIAGLGEEKPQASSA